MHAPIRSKTAATASDNTAGLEIPTWSNHSRQVAAFIRINLIVAARLSSRLEGTNAVAFFNIGPDNIVLIPGWART
jgi:hypothetical protein